MLAVVDAVVVIFQYFDALGIEVSIPLSQPDRDATMKQCMYADVSAGTHCGSM